MRGPPTGGPLPWHQRGLGGCLGPGTPRGSSVTVGIVNCRVIVRTSVPPRDERAHHPWGWNRLTPVRHRCYTASVPTKHRRHAITETPPVRAALDELREEIGGGRIEFGELVILGAHQKVAQLRAERDDAAARRRRLADRIRRRDVGVDVAAADEVRRSGWARR